MSLPTAIKFGSEYEYKGESRRQAFTIRDQRQLFTQDHSWEGMFVGTSKQRRCVHVEFFRNVYKSKKEKKKKIDKKKWIHMANENKIKMRCALCERAFPSHALPGRITHRSVTKCREMFRERMQDVEGLPVGMNKPRLFANLYDTAQLCIFCSQFFPLAHDDSEDEDPEPWTAVTPVEELSKHNYQQSDICRRRTSVSWPVWAKITTAVSNPKSGRSRSKTIVATPSSEQQKSAKTPPPRARLTLLLNSVAQTGATADRKLALLRSIEKLSVDVERLEGLLDASLGEFPFPKKQRRKKKRKKKRELKSATVSTANHSQYSPRTHIKPRRFLVPKSKKQPEKRTLHKVSASFKNANEIIRTKTRNRKMKKMKESCRDELDNLYEPYQRRDKLR